MSKTPQLTAAILAALALPSLAVAQDVPWRAVLSASANMTSPGLPAAGRYFTDAQIGDTGNSYIAARLTSPSSAAGYWALKQGTWTQFTKLGVTGGAMGPGRAGAEAGHVFLSVDSGGTDVGPDGQRVLFAQAGDPANTTTATWGAWRWDKTKNIEVARALTDGVLGPNLGANWVYQNSYSAFAGASEMNNGQVLINAYVTSPTGLSRQYLGKGVPGQATTPCVLRNSTDPALAPGLVAGDSFDSPLGFAALSQTVDGRVYGVLTTNQSRDGIWKLCDGAPQALVVDNETGARGPDIGSATATFLSFDPVQPGNGSEFYFFARYRLSANDSSALGLFWHDGATNRPLAINDTANQYGPGWSNSVWNSFDEYTLTAAGEWTAFQATVSTSDGGHPAGLWRVRKGGAPALVALLGLTGQYGPESNRTWGAFYGKTVLANGDIIADARTEPGAERAVWLLKKDSAPRRILKIGQTVSVPNSTGTAQASVTSYTVPSGSATPSRGIDSWVGADGSLLLSVNLTNYGSTLITATPSNPIDKIFVNGFDG